MVSENWFREMKHANKSGVVHFFGYFRTTTGGALNTAFSDSPGFTFNRINTGRYTIQLVNSKGENVTFCNGGPANPKTTPALAMFSATISPSAGEVTAGKGIQSYVRNGPDLVQLSASGRIDIQFATGANPPVDGDVEDGAALIIAFALKRGSAVP